MTEVTPDHRRSVLGITYVTGNAAVSTFCAGAALLASWNRQGYAGYVVICVVCLLMSVLWANRYATSLAWLARGHVWARICLGLSFALVGGTIVLGVAVLVQWTGLTGSTFGTLVSVIVFGSLSGFLALLGLGVAAGRVDPETILNRVSIFLDGYSTDLTFAGWLALLVTAAATFGLGVPLAMWLYNGVRPPWVPSVVLAIPVLALAGLTWGLCALIARVLGLRLLR